MFICRLFHRAQPFEQVDARLLADGAISIGRDPEADWPLDDPEHMLSRIHCSLSVEDGRLMLRDSSTNGTFLGSGERVPRDVPVPVEWRETLRIGGLSILIDRPSEEDCGGDADRTMLALPIATVPVALPSSWIGDAEPVSHSAHRDTPLLEAFCEGAGLDVSALSSDDPTELMRRLGGIYRQSVLGLSTLVTERARLKTDSKLDRTTIGAIDNNPFKWAPTRKLARELLSDRDDGFLTGEVAVRASFEDLARHLAGTATGAAAAIRAVLAALDPHAIDREAAAQGFSLKSRATLSREIHERRHAALLRDDDRDDNAAAHAFREAYIAGAAEKPAS